MDYEKRVHSAIREIVVAGLAESAHDLSDGGLAVALAESSAAGIGADVAVISELTPELLLFHEGPSRVLISTTQFARVTEIADRHTVEAVRVGTTVKDQLRIRNNSETLVSVDVATLRKTSEEGLAGKLELAHA